MRLIKIFRLGMGAASVVLGALSAYALISNLRDWSAERHGR